MDARVQRSERGDIPQGTPYVPFCSVFPATATGPDYGAAVLLAALCVPRRDLAPVVGHTLVVDLRS